MQTYMANPDKIERKWYVVDAEGCTLGRLASGVASVLSVINSIILFGNKKRHFISKLS